MKRDDRWDFYRGLLMFSVVLGHTITALKNGIDIPAGIHVFIRTFDMPAFAFISGYFLQKSCRKHPLGINLLNKVGSILVPVILWSGMINLILGESFFTLGRLWFLWSIFFVSCIILCVDWVGQKVRILKLPLFIVCIALFHTVIRDPWNIGFLLFPAVVGYYYDDMKKGLDRIRHPQIVKWSFVLAFGICLLSWSTDYSVWNAGCNMLAPGAFWKIVFRGFVGIVGWLAAKTVYDYVYEMMQRSRSRVLCRIKGCVVYLGKTTLEMYILQTIFVEIFGYIAVMKVVELLGMNPFAVNPLLLTLVFAPIVTACALAVMSLVNAGMNKIPVVGKYIYGMSWTDIKRITGGHDR